MVPTTLQHITPLRLQLDALDCGAAALGIILDYYGKTVPQQILRQACLTERGTVTSTQLLTAVRHYGLQAQFIRATLQTFIDTPALLPAIALWEKTHFLVVESVGGGAVCLNDPQHGRYQLPLADFEKSFSHAAIILSPGPDFQAAANQPSQPPPTLEATLASGIIGDVSQPTGKYSQYQHDFGHILQKTPQIVVRALCEEDIVHALTVSQAQQIPVRLRGAGHSCYGQSLTDRGILLVNVADHGVVTFDPASQQATVTSRSRWRYAEKWLNRHGRTFPVLTDNLNTAVGGTLSVGGYGPRSVRYGSQISQVQTLRLIRPDGTAVPCSRSQNEQLFRYSLAALGQLGIIEQVTLNTIPRQKDGNWWQHSVDTFQNMAELFALMQPEENRPNAFMGYYLRQQGILACYKLDDATAVGPLPRYLQQMGAKQTDSPINLGSLYRQTGQKAAHMPAVDYILPISNLADFLALLDRFLADESIAQYVPGALLLAIHSDPADYFPFEAASFGTDRLKALVGFYPIVPQGDSVGLQKIQGMMRQMLAACIQLGGRPYLYGWHELDLATKQQLYGPAYHTLHRLKQQLDPAQLYNMHTF